MPNDIKKLLAAAKANPSDGRTMAALLDAVEALSSFVKLMVLDQQLSELSTQVGAATETDLPADDHSKAEALNNLEEFVSMRTDEAGKREFLLHRLTVDSEYADSIEGLNAFETHGDTEWITNLPVAEHQQDVSEIEQGVAPVVSCWIHEDKIKEIPNSPSNTGIWGNLGKNPQGSKYTIIVKPGTYEIHQELRQ
jgi:hypothetical protein